MEDHSAHRNLGTQYFNQVPGDCFTFAVLIGCQNEFVGILHKGFEFVDLGALVRIDDVERLETFFNIDAFFGPGDLLIFLGDISCSLRQVSNVADRGLDNVVLPEKAAYFASFRGGFHDNEFCTHSLMVPCGEALRQVEACYW